MLPSLIPAKKLTKVEKELVLSVFNCFESNENIFNSDKIHTNLKRVKSPNRLDLIIEKTKDKKLQKIKSTVIELLNKPKENWTENEKNLMKTIGEPKLLYLIKNI